MTDPSPTAVGRRVLPAPPDLVYDEWLDAEGMLDWMCPVRRDQKGIELEPRVGGRLFIDLDDQGTKVSIAGTFLVLNRPAQLQFTWRTSTWASSAPQSVVTVRLAPHGDDETLMTIEHAQVPPDLIERYLQGWTLIADQLGAHLGAP
ncbi:MAG: SRPBCC domain-containing protein [Chloroflexi bacterium]|nr:SRPBCC domain-containing protein [Chloroflexota bacterium]